MKKIRWMLLLIAALLCAHVSPASGMQENTPALVGHIAYLDGRLLRYVPETKDWVATVKDAPFGLQDALYADKDALAEIIMPNSTMLRIGGSTQAQLLRMTSDSTEIDIASGKVRFYNTGSSTAIRATTPFGQVVAPAGSVFDLYVGDDSVEVIAVKAAVDYVHPAGSTKYPVHAGASSIIATRSQVASGEGLTDAAWNSWNADRDRIWARRLESRGDTVRYVPPELSAESYVLEEQGRWENVYYDGGYRQFWRPTYVSAGWSPYTCGRWTTWYGDQVWIPAEPFGYVTHHYGCWVYVGPGRGWYWAPPVSVGVAVVPAYTISYGWYPGRVSWIYSETYVGWVPLAPYEPYYCHNYWGPSVIIVADFDDDHHHGRHHDDHHGRHHYKDHAVVVNQNNFYTVNNYNDVRVKNVDRAAIAKAYRGSPVINSMVIKNHKDLLQKYNFADINVRRKPHQSVLDRVQQNIAAAKRGQRQPASAILQRLDRMKEGKPADGTVFKGRQQQVTDKLVPSRETARPKTATSFATRELKTSGQIRPNLPETKEPLRGKTSIDAGRERPEPKKFGAGTQADQSREKPQPPSALQNRPAQDKDRPEPAAQPEGGTPDEQRTRLRPDRSDDKPVAGRPERFKRPEQADTPRPERPAPPVFDRPETSKPEPRKADDAWRPRMRPDHDDTSPAASRPERPVPPAFDRPGTSRSEPRQTDNAWRPKSSEQQPSQKTDRAQPRMRPDHDDTSPAVSRPERYQRPVETTPHVDRAEQPSQPRSFERPVRSEPRAEQPRTIQQPREASPAPRHTEQPSRQQPRVQQPSGSRQQKAPQNYQQQPWGQRGFQR